MQSPDLIAAVQAALTPTVLISSAAILASGVSQKHADLGNRIRALMAELRRPDVPEPRQRNLREQIQLFRRRTRFAQSAHVCLYASVLPFVAMIAVLMLRAAPLVAEVLLLVGVALLLLAIACEVLELALAGRSIQLALEDDTPDRS
jgi:formate hydrogenlyase subunit 4